MSTNTSGYEGVSWHKAARKWGAYIRQDGVRRYLGLFNTAKKAGRAYRIAEAELRPAIDPAEERKKLIAAVRDLYQRCGIEALSTRFLYKQPGNLGHRLSGAGLKQAALLEELGLAAEHTAWRNSNRTYRGVTKPKWTWDVAVVAAREIVERDGDLPSVQECRLNGLSSLTSAVHLAGKTWEELRAAVGLGPNRYYQSRNGMRWRSRPETSLSNFLYARGIKHKRGERYPASYSKQSGRRSAHYDLHFLSRTGDWIDVEVWGDLPHKLAKGRYQETKAMKVRWNAKRPHFLGIQYQDCLKDARLTKVLEPYLGVIKPYVFDKSLDQEIETALWANADELLASCREIAAERPDGIFPTENWLRKRGKYVDRPGPFYNSVAIRVNQWLGGTREVRRLLGQEHASTFKWTPEITVQAWQEFENRYGYSPSQVRAPKLRKTLPDAAVKIAYRIYQAATQFGVRAEARNGINKRIKWTRERTLTAWLNFIKKHRCSPTKCMSKLRRRTMSRAVTDEATNIYGAARRVGVLDEARKLEKLALLKRRTRVA